MTTTILSNSKLNLYSVICSPLIDCFSDPAIFGATVESNLPLHVVVKRWSCKTQHTHERDRSSLPLAQWN